MREHHFKGLYLISVSTGAAVACIYLNQPLLHVLGQDFHATDDRIGLVASLTQIGYAAGLFFLVPLGDVVSKKGLIVAKQLLLSLVLLATSFVGSLPMLFALSLLIGLLASVAQDFVPLAADLAEDATRGKTIGAVMTGLFAGILLSRTLSGFISDIAGWRCVFALFCAINLALAALVALRVPANVPRSKASYARLLKSLVGHFMTQPQLRYSFVTQGFLGLAFSAFWTSLSFYLSRPPFSYSVGQIGLLGIAGAAGVLAAPLAGRMADRYSPYRGVMIGALLVAAAFSAMSLAPASIAVLIAATVIFDLGMQMSLVSHQAIIYALDVSARARINGIFMTGMFLFFALGSLLSAQAQQRFGWRGVLTLSLISAIVALATAAKARRRFLKK